MTVQTVRIDDLRPAMALGPQHFISQHSGSFLLALGLVAAETTDERGYQRSQTAEWQVAEDTLTMNFGERLKHGLDAHPLAGRAFYFPTPDPKRTLIAGRVDSSDLQIPDSSVSERHCGVRVDSDKLIVTDLNSTNGTWADLSPLMPGMPRQVLDEGMLTIGRYSFQFYCAPSMCRALQLLGSGF